MPFGKEIISEKQCKKDRKIFSESRNSGTSFYLVKKI